MEWGAHLHKLPEDSKVINERPVLMAGLEFYFNAYQELLSERQIGMAVGSIPWYSIIKWAKFHGLDYNDTDILITYIRAMEQAQREYEKKHDK